MLGVVLNEARKASDDQWFDGPDGWSFNATKRYIKAPSGREYNYKGKRKLPSKEEIDALVQHDIPEMAASLPGKILGASPTAEAHVPAQLQAKSDPHGGRPIVPTMTVPVNRPSNAITAMEAGKKIDEAQGRLTDKLAVLDVLAPFAKSGLPFTKPSELASAAIMAPVQTYASAGILGDKDSSINERVGAAAEILSNFVGPAELLSGFKVVGKPLFNQVLKAVHGRDAVALRQALMEVERQGYKATDLAGPALTRALENAKFPTGSFRAGVEAGLVGTGRRERMKALPARSPEAVPPGGYSKSPEQLMIEARQLAKADIERELNPSRPASHPTGADPGRTVSGSQAIGVASGQSREAYIQGKWKNLIMARIREADDILRHEPLTRTQREKIQKIRGAFKRELDSGKPSIETTAELGNEWVHLQGRAGGFPQGPTPKNVNIGINERANAHFERLTREQEQNTGVNAGMTTKEIEASRKKLGIQPPESPPQPKPVVEKPSVPKTVTTPYGKKVVPQGEINASKVKEAGPVHGDVQSSALKGEGQVPPEGRGAGVRQEAPKEVDLTGVTGLARRFRDPERIAAGKEVTPPVPKSARDLAEKGKKLYETGKADPQEILTRVAEGKGKPSFEKDVPVIQHYKAVVRDQKTVLLNARKKANPGELPEIDLGIAKLDQETDRIEAFAQKAATEFHGMGEALQIARDESMAFVDLRDRAIAGNFGQRVGAKIEAQLSDLSKRYESAMAEIERLKSRISLPRAAPISQIGRRRSSALSRLKRLGIETAEFQSYPLGSKQTGAIDLSGVGTARQQARQAITDLTGIYIREGARDLDEVLEMLSKDVPGLSRDDFLSLLSPSIRKYRTEAAVVSNEARKVLSKVRASAEFRTKSMVGKGLAIAADIGKNLKRNVQASFDVSAALLQGKPALLARPGSWLKSWEATAQAFSPVARNVEGKVKYQGADQAAQRLYANLIQEPAIKEAVDQGWLELRQPHGSFSPQEEIFRGEIAHVIPGVARSDAMFSSQLNAMYGDWYRKLAGIMPENAEYKRSIGAIMNMLSGRGHGPTAQMLSHPSMGWLSFAPKFAYSLAQVGTGAPVWYKGLHPRARLEALKIYTAGIATVAVVNQVAPRFGYTVDNDPRSINFGMLEKDGKSIDGYNQITQFPRMLMQLFFGKIGGRGQYKEPGDFGFAPLNDYIGSKFSPALRDLVFMSTGRIYDRQKHEWRDATRDDLNWSFTPLAIQDIRNMENRDLKSVVLAILGGRPGDVEPKRLKQGEKSAPPLKYPPIGIERMTRGL